MGKSPWNVGTSGNPNGRGRPMRAAKGKEADLLRRIGRELVEFTDENPPDEESGEPRTETATYSRFERICRVLLTMAGNGHFGAIRTVLEYVIGKPGRVPPDGSHAGGAPTADDMAQLCLFDDEDEG